MNEIKIIGKINELLYTATDLCCGWLNKMLPRISDNWWTNCVLDSLSFNQNQLAQEKGYTELKQLDLAALLRVIDKNWYAMRNFAYLPTKDRETVRRMMRVRNYSGHNKKKKVSHNDQITSGAYPVPYVPPSYGPDN